MTKTDEDYSPENPRNWDPNYPSLRSPAAPHETAAVLRCVRAGNTGQRLFQIFKGIYRGSQLEKAVQLALDQETNARTAGLPIHNGR